MRTPLDARAADRRFVQARLNRQEAAMPPTTTSRASAAKTVLAACPHDCPDTCSMLVTVEDDRVVKVRGQPRSSVHRRTALREGQPLRGARPPPGPGALSTASDADRRARGSSPASPGSQALDEIATRWKRDHRGAGAHRHPALQLSRYRGNSERAERRATLSSTSWARRSPSALSATRRACTGYMMTVGPTPGTDPESFVHSRYIILWACNTISTNLHHWPFIAEAQKRGAKVVVIDPVRTRTARQADWHIPIKPGTDGALAMAMINVDHRRGLGRQRLCGEVHRRVRRARRARKGVPAREGRGDHRHPRRRHPQARARIRDRTQPSVIRIGVAVERHSGGGQTVRALTCLPALVGAWRDVGGGILQLPIWAFPVKWDGLMRPDWIKPGTRVLNQWKLGTALTGELKLDPPIQSLFVYNANPMVVAPEQEKVIAGLARDGSVHRRQRALHHRHRALRRYRAARHHADGAARGHVLVGPLLPVAQPAGDRAARRSGAQHRAVPAPGGGDGFRRSVLQAKRRADGDDALDWSSPALAGHHAWSSSSATASPG